MRKRRPPSTSTGHDADSSPTQTLKRQGRHPVQRVAIYVKGAPAKSLYIISGDEQETSCRDYCQERQIEPSDVFHDQAGRRDESYKMIELATSANAPYAAVMVWKMNRFAISLDETIEYRDRLRRAGVRVISTTEKGVEEQWPDTASIRGDMGNTAEGVRKTPCPMPYNRHHPPVDRQQPPIPGGRA